MSASVSPAGVRNAQWAFRHRRRRTVAAIVLGVITSLQPACYAYVPLQGAQAAPGEHVGLLVSDEGRIALRDQMGQGVDRIEGILLEKSGDDYLMRVSRVTTIRGQAAHWTGEQVRVPLSTVARVEGRKVSRRKTLLMVGGLVAGAAILLATGALGGFGFDNERPNPEPGGPPDQ